MQAYIQIIHVHIYSATLEVNLSGCLQYFYTKILSKMYTRRNRHQKQHSHLVDMCVSNKFQHLSPTHYQYPQAANTYNPVSSDIKSQNFAHPYLDWPYDRHLNDQLCKAVGTSGKQQQQQKMKDVQLWFMMQSLQGPCRDLQDKRNDHLQACHTHRNMWHQGDSVSKSHVSPINEWC